MAERKAKVNFEWLTFVGSGGATPPVETLGDLNSDGEVNSTDYAGLRRHILNITTLTGTALLNADLNKDSLVNSTDYALMKRYILGSISFFQE